MTTIFIERIEDGAGTLVLARVSLALVDADGVEVVGLRTDTQSLLVERRSLALESAAGLTIDLVPTALIGLPGPIARPTGYRITISTQAQDTVYPFVQVPSTGADWPLVDLIGIAEIAPADVSAELWAQALAAADAATAAAAAAGVSATAAAASATVVASQNLATLNEIGADVAADDSLMLWDASRAAPFRVLASRLTAFLSGIFVSAAGREGGQTLVGGASATDGLILRGTAGAGEPAAAAITVRASDGSDALIIFNSGDVRFANGSQLHHNGVKEDAYNHCKISHAYTTTGNDYKWTRLSPTAILCNAIYERREVEFNLGDRPVLEPYRIVGGMGWSQFCYASGDHAKDSLYGILLDVGNKGVGAISTLVGIQAYSMNHSASAVTNQYGGYFWSGVGAGFGGGGTVGTAIAVYGRISATSAIAATISTAVGIDSNVGTSALNALITVYGLRARIGTNAGTIGTYYGLYLDASIAGKAATTYAIYSAPAVQSYIAGNVSIGVNSTAGRLVVQGVGTAAGVCLQAQGSGGAVGLKVLDDGTFIRPISKTPASATAAGTQGEMAWDANYIYICTAANVWKRAAIATW